MRRWFSIAPANDLPPLGNRIGIVGYDGIQFTKASHVLRSMGWITSRRSGSIEEFTAKGMAPDPG